MNFFAANAPGATIYVPTTAATDDSVAYGLGDYLKRLGRVVGRVEYVVLLGGAIVGTIAFLGW